MVTLGGVGTEFVHISVCAFLDVYLRLTRSHVEFIFKHKIMDTQNYLFFLRLCTAARGQEAGSFKESSRELSFHKCPRCPEHSTIYSHLNQGDCQHVVVMY